MEPKVIVMGLPGRKPVEDASAVLKRLYLIERETMRTLGGYLVNVSRWELKKKLPYHIWQDSLRADALRTRVLELRYPRRDVDQAHDPGLLTYLHTLIHCRHDAELITGVYFVTKQALLAAYERYLLDADPLDDAPTMEFMRGYPAQLRQQLEEIREIYEELPEVSEGEDHTRKHALKAFLGSIGGLLGLEEQDAHPKLPQVLVQETYTPPLEPVRDPRFTPARYHMPPLEWEKFLEHQVWAGINHVNEIWASEVPGDVEVG